MKKLLLLLFLLFPVLSASAEDFNYQYEGQILTYTIIDRDATTCRLKEGKYDGWNDMPGNEVFGDLIIPSEAKYLNKYYKVVEISPRAFCNSKKLTSVIIPNSITAIGEKAFAGCWQLASVNIPNTITTIGYRMFYECGALTSIDIPNSVTKIGSQAFERCTGLTSIVIPNSVTTIGEGIFCGCSKLSSAAIPNNITSITNSMFERCSKLASIEIPNSVTSIDYQAFYGCESLVSIKIPYNVTFIGYKTFSGCQNLKYIYSLNSTPPQLYFYGDAYETFDDDQLENSTVYVPQEALETYKTDINWGYFANIKSFDPTGINGIEADGIGKQNVYYDLNGRRLDAPKKGINIINGKKVVVR